jgi:phage head maturation protease
MKPEVILRAAPTLAGVDVAERIVDVIAVPWEQQARVRWRGEMWTETFTRGAFPGVEKQLVRVNREHVKGDTVGRVLEFDNGHPDGLLARVKVAKTARGDETLALAAEDMISASIGYQTRDEEDVTLDRVRRTRRVHRAVLDHLSLVEDPAFKGAQVLAVRAATPNLDRVLADPAFREILRSGRGR